MRVDSLVVVILVTSCYCEFCKRDVTDGACSPENFLFSYIMTTPRTLKRNRTFILKSASKLSQMECGHLGHFLSISHLEFHPPVVIDEMRSSREMWSVVCWPWSHESVLRAIG